MVRSALPSSCMWRPHSHRFLDETNLGPRRFLVEVDTTLEHLRKQEDTDNNYQITIEDRGPKVD
jgi:hypothetical protein